MTQEPVERATIERERGLEEPVVPETGGPLAAVRVSTEREAALAASDETGTRPAVGTGESEGLGLTTDTASLRVSRTFSTAAASCLEGTVGTAAGVLIRESWAAAGAVSSSGLSPWKRSLPVSKLGEGRRRDSRRTDWEPCPAPSAPPAKPATSADNISRASSASSS